MKNKWIAVLTAMFLLLTAALPAFGEKAPDGKKQIVCSTFPEYDWVRNILGDSTAFELTLLQKSGADLHNFQPSAQDFIKISDCDLFVYIGGVSDEWAHDAIAEAKNKNMVVLNLMNVLEEGGLAMMAHHEHDEHHEDCDGHEHPETTAQANHDHPEATAEAGHAGQQDHDHDHGEEHEHHDEHLWLSLKNAQLLVKHLSQAISGIDAEHGAQYEANAEVYVNQLTALDQEYTEAVKAASRDTVLFASRFPFVYLMRDYGINHFEAFSGCSAESEASFETITKLSEKVKELKLSSLMIIDNSTDAIAKSIINAAGEGEKEILTLNSMQGVTEDAVEKGVNYLDIMRENLLVLKQALK